MRLIDVETLQVVSFTDYEIPKYAILSHVWGPEEVTFQDINDLAKARQMQGFAKIEVTCV